MLKSELALTRLQVFIMPPVPPVPVRVSQKDLPRVLAIVVLGYAIVFWLVLWMDNYFAAEDQDKNFSFPFVHLPRHNIFSASLNVIKLLHSVK